MKLQAIGLMAEHHKHIKNVFFREIKCENDYKVESVKKKFTAPFRKESCVLHK